MCTCESIRPGMAVMPSASITTSAASTSAADAVPTRTMRSPSVTIVSPDMNGSRQLPDTMRPRLTTAIFMRTSLRRRAQRVVQIVGREQRLDQCGRAVPVIGAKAVPRRHEPCAGIEHLVLHMPRAEFGADSVPCRLHEFDLVLRIHRRGALRLFYSRADLRIGEVEHG